MGKKWIITVDEISEAGSFTVKESKSVEGDTPLDALNKIVNTMCHVISQEHEAEMNELKDRYIKDDDVPF